MEWNAARGLTTEKTDCGHCGRLARTYQVVSKDLKRVMNRLKAPYRSWGIPCTGTRVYSHRHREQWLKKIGEAGVRRRAELFYQQLDASQLRLHSLGQQAFIKIQEWSRTTSGAQGRAFEDLLHRVIVILIETANLR
jgi:hypothetical protein